MRLGVLSLLIASCSAPPETVVQPVDPPAPFIGPSPLRRLTNTEYLNALSDLFPTVHVVLPALPADTVVAGFENDAEAQAPTDVRIARYEEIARLYAVQAPFESVAVTGARLFRRPLSPDELSRWSDTFARLGPEDTLAAMLQAPQFIYRLEHAPPTPAELASRLAFFLWESVPDDALVAAAAHGTLDVRAQATRMLRDPKANRVRWSFHRQWLGLDRILGDEHSARSPEVDPTWTPATQAAAFADTKGFVEHSSSLTALLTEHGGVFQRVAWLAGNSHRGGTSPPIRGNALQSRLLCLPPVSPPPNADLSAPTSSEGVTNRERFESRTAPAMCQACHASLNGLGFGFEHWSAAGAWQDTDHGESVNAHGVVLGTDVDGPFDGADALVAKLAASADVRRCAAERWLRYALGRAPVAGEASLVDALAEPRLDFDAVLLRIVTSPTFRGAR